MKRITSDKLYLRFHIYVLNFLYIKEKTIGSKYKKLDIKKLFKTV